MMKEMGWNDGLARGMGRSLVGAIALGIALMAVAQAPNAWADDWQVESGDERQQRIIERYQSMLEEEPVEGMALERLLGHVGRGAGLDGLIDHYGQRVQNRPEAVNLRLILGHLFKARGDYEEALAQYERAVELDRHNSLSWLSRGTVQLLMGDRQAAMVDFEEALERESDRERRHELLEELGNISFSQREFDRGIEFYERLLQAKPRDRFVRMEYVRLLVQYRQLEEAISQYEVLRGMVADDTRQTATLLRDKADVYEMIGDHQAALDTYEEAKALVRSDSWLAREIRQQMVEVFRRAGTLDEFLEEYGAAWRQGDSQQRMMVADIHSELGRLEEALTMYEAIARRDRRAVEPRHKAIRVLERLGRDDEIPEAYRELIRADPDDQGHRFELAEYYMRLGDRDAAKAVLDQLQRRFSGQSYVLLELAERYARWNFGTDAQETYETVLAGESDDDAVLIEVGDYYFDRGNRQRALDIWQMLPDSQLGPREGQRRMAELLVQRGVMAEGISAYEELMEDAADDERLLRGMARALERANRWDDALQRWEQLLTLTETPRRQREARARMIELYDRMQELRARMRNWEATFENDMGAPGRDAGFFLAEAHLHLRDLSKTESVLLELKQRPDLSDDERTATLLALEQTYVRGDRFEEAIAVLEELVEHQPQMSRELLERQSEHAMAGNAAESAVDFARRALDTNPDDARTQARMGRVYRNIGNLEAAAEHFQTAADIDIRDFEVRLELGETLEALGRRGEAQQALMEVVEDATQDQLVRDAGQRLLAMADASGRLAALESQWSRLVYRMPVRHAHAQLMFQLYDLLAGPLMLQAYHGPVTQRAGAQEQLFELGGRAAPLLMEQLQRDDGSSRARALRMVAEMQVVLAAPQVARIIATDEDPRIRQMAIATAARLGDDRFVEPLSAALEDGSATVRHLSAWALGFMDDDRARDILAELADTDVDGTEARLAVAGLGNPLRDNDRQVVMRQLQRMIDDPVAVQPERAALLLTSVVGEVRDDEGQLYRPLIEELADTRRDPVGAWAARVLGRYGDPKAAQTLWQMAHSTDYVEARQAEMGLVEMLGDTPSKPRRWEDEIRFFDWSNGNFRPQDLVRRLGRRWTSRRPMAADQAWSESVQEGLGLAVQAQGGEDTDAVLARMRAQLLGFGTSEFWTIERSRKYSKTVLQGVPDELSTDIAWQLEMLAGHYEGEWNERAVDGSDGAFETVAALAAAQSSSPGQWPEWYMDALRSSDSSTRRIALRSIRHLPEDESLHQPVRQAVIDGLNDRDMAVQLAAISAARGLQMDGIDEILADLERDARPALRRAVRQTRRSLDVPSH